ncbi:FERM domain-containing protein, partial [Euroglyphus maynei]
MSEERAFLLASYALQADYGNYNPKLHKNRYFDPYHYFPSWVRVIEELGHEYIHRYLPSLHCDHKGMSKSEAQSMFIREASDPMAGHNFHLYKMVSNKKASSTTLSGDTWLAITITGLMIYAADSLPTSQICNRRLKTRISFFPWSDIGKLSFDKKKFEIRSIGPQSRKFIYYTGSEEMARFLLWFSRASHQFHLMVLPKMREMLKREAEINRRKYRENCISTTSSRASSSGNSSGTCGVSGSSNINSNTTSKSTSPFDFSSAASSSSGSAVNNAKKCVTSDLDISTSSVCYGMMDCGDSAKDPCEELDDRQRVSVISNASSNTTSGIASDKMHSGLGDDDSDPESDLLMSLNGHHDHHHRAITLSGCSPQPVVSMESLAMSEPINDNHRSHHNHQHHHINHSSEKSAMMRNKKHSISISNIMITANAETSSPISSSSSCSSNSQIKATINTALPSATATEIVVNPEKNSKVSLCLNINGSRSSKSSKKSKANDSDSENSDDDDDEIDSSIDKNNRYSSSKSNVTVLSTILKPEAERLLKQGIEAEDVIDAFNNASDRDAINSLELAELKEFEQQEKEKIILNSLIDNIPPPPPLTSSMDSSDSSDSSDSDSSDDDDDNAFPSPKPNRHHYSPLAQEKRLHDKQQQHNTDFSSPNHRNITPARLRSKSSTESIQQSNNDKLNTLRPKIFQMNHIYENIPFSDAASTDKYSQVVQALITTPNTIHSKRHNGFPPTVSSLCQYPSLNSVPNASNYPHRTGMRIGISSLSRPGSVQKNAAHLLLQGGCVHTNGNSSNLCAGSEPNLYFSESSQLQKTKQSENKSDSIAVQPRTELAINLSEAQTTAVPNQP